MLRGPTLSLVVVGFVGFLALGGCGDDSDGDIDAFCATARRFAVDNPADVIGANDPADLANFGPLLHQAADLLGAWAEDAPPDLRPDVERLALGAEDLADVYEGGSEDPATTARLETGRAEVEAASARVTEATREQCSVELDVVLPNVSG